MGKARSVRDRRMFSLSAPGVDYEFVIQMCGNREERFLKFIPCRRQTPSTPTLRSLT